MENQGRLTLLERAREAPVEPGCYLMKDSAGTILYVGKAKSLRARVSSYFARAPHEHPRTEMMVLRVDHFDLILTETENEALILENTLIKRHKPQFNVRLKDDKAYPYLKLRLQEDFPRLEWARRVLKDGARYFGPFPSAWAARQVMNLIVETLQLRDCSDNTFKHRTRACILHQMGRCKAPCVGAISREEYQADIREVVRILDGKSSRLVKELRRAMDEAAENQEYERAAQLRDQLKNIEVVTQTQSVAEIGSARDRDVVGLGREGSEAQVSVLRIRGGHLIAVQHFHLSGSDSTQTDGELLMDVLSQLYGGVEEQEGTSAAQEVLVSAIPREDEAGLIETLQRTRGIAVVTAEQKKEPARTRDLQLLSVAQTNAQYALEQVKRKPEGHGIQALEAVQEKLGLGKLPSRIECYDISNTQGEEAVASRVVFIDGAPDKNLYRRYKIRTVQGANDFAMMHEVLERRFRNTEESLPDLVVVDGGKGQLAQAVAILKELGESLGLQGVSVAGLAKARTESDFQAPELKSSFERVFIPGRKNPVSLLPHTAAYKLLVHVRDEAHRFAISYHRLLRGKRSLQTGDSKE